MRSTETDYKEGDFVPLKTAMGNIVYCEILDKNYTITYGDFSQTGILYDEHALLLYVDELEFRRKNKLDCIGLNCGLERSGKSMLVYCKKKIYESPLFKDKDKLKHILTRDDWKIKDFSSEFSINLRDINFTLKNFKLSLNEAIEGYENIITNDESGVGLSSLNWYDKEQTNLYIQFQVIGIKRIIAELLLPHQKDLNNRFRDRRVSSLALVSWKRNETELDRGYVDFRQSNPSNWELETYWKPWFVCKFPDLSFEDDWKKYTEKKLAFVNQIGMELDNEQEMKEMDKTERKYYDQSNDLIEELLNPKIRPDNKSYNNVEIARLLNCTKQAFGERLSRARYYKQQKLDIEIKHLKEIDKQNKENELCQTL